MAILTKIELVQYCLRKLGDPIVQINVTDDQLDDCFMQSIETWWHFHPDGLEKMYLKHQVTGSKITVADPTLFVVGNSIMLGTGQPNPDTGVVALIQAINGSVLTIEQQQGAGRLAVTNVVSNQNNQGAGTTTVTAIVLGDMDNRWIPTSDQVYGVTRVLPFGGGSGGSTSSSRSMFDLQYQMRLNNMTDLTSTSIAYYVEAMTHLGMLDAMLNGPNLFRFNRLTNKLYIEAAWGSELHVNDYIITECYTTTDPEVNPRAFSEPWLRKHLIANIKAQWGTNMKKFAGIQMLGGVTIDGQALYEEGTSEMKELEEDIVMNGAPCEFFMG